MNGSFPPMISSGVRFIFGTEIIVTEILLIHRGKQTNPLSFLSTSHAHGWLVCLFIYMSVYKYSCMCVYVCVLGSEDEEGECHIIALSCS